jgi:uncharacterized protein (DUF58 family)
VPGDDIRHVDWKVFGRSDRFYIKQYEEETNLVCHVLLDVSESMRYSSNGWSKYEYALTLAASLMVLLLRQQDAVGLALFDSEIRRLVPASSRPAHLRALLSVADAARPERKTDLSALFHRFAEETRRRGLIVLVSDLLAPADDILDGLKHLRYRRHEVVVFHVLDPQELDFEFRDNTLFKGMEDLPELLAEPRALRRAYRQAAGRFIDRMRRGCRDQRIDYELLRTTDPLDIALSRYLTSRARSGKA